MTLRWTIGLLRQVIAVGLLCAALAAPVAAADGKRLTTEAEFRELVADRQLTRDQTALLYTGDGRMEGTSRGMRIQGAWRWAGALLCRSATLGSKSLGLDCQAVFVINDLVVIVRDEGRGNAFALRLPGETRQPGASEDFACFC